MTDPDEMLTCTLCSKDIPPEHVGDADAFGNARDRTCDQLFVIVRCMRCVSTSVIADGGEC